MKKKQKTEVKKVNELYDNNNVHHIEIHIKDAIPLSDIKMEEYEGTGYRISLKGDVYTRNGKKLKASRNNIGRGLFVTLRNKHGQEQRKNVAILVANTFVPNPDNFMLVAFKDGNPENCSADNLYWTNAKNTVPTRQRVYLPTKSESDSFVTPTARKVLQYSKDGKFIREWKSIKAASRGANSHTSSITLCCSGKQKTANGYIWKFADIPELPGTGLELAAKKK